MVGLVCVCLEGGVFGFWFWFCFFKIFGIYSDSYKIKIDNVLGSISSWLL